MYPSIMHRGPRTYCPCDPQHQEKTQTGRCTAWCAASMILIKTPNHLLLFPGYTPNKSSLQYIYYSLHHSHITSPNPTTTIVMANLSTLRNQLYSTLDPDTLSAYSQNLQSAASTPSKFRPQDDMLSSRLPTGELQYEHIPPPLSTTYAPVLGCDHGPAPTDGGETSWYCQACGDGPYGSWQASCQNCYKNR